MCNCVPTCYEKGYCYFCRVKNCDKRKKELKYGNIESLMCDGNCYKCKRAIRSRFYCKLYVLEDLYNSFKGCMMYDYLVEMKNFKFCGRKENIEEFSEIELVILQLKKCYDCKRIKTYEKLLKDINSKIEKIPACYESMTELTSTKTLHTTYYAILEILQNQYNCKEKIVLKRLIKEYLDNYNEEKVNLEDLCSYIKQKQKNLDYFVHPLTISSLVDEVLNISR